MPKQDIGADAAQAVSQLQALENQASADSSAFLRDLFAEAYRNHSNTGATVWGMRGPEGVARTPSGVLVNSKDMVMQVFLDAGANYSVAGYNERAGKCFGPIYLGLDSGPEYERQARKVNAAIQRIGAAEAFTLALRETRKALAAKPAADDATVAVMVLAGICTQWFDLPDALNVVEGGMRFDAKPPGRCPGDFAFPSGYIFKPDPEQFLITAGQALGNLLKAGVARFVADLRAANKQPSGTISRVIFDAFPNGEDDLIARTIIGVMMGMLPTVNLNLINTMDAWRADGDKIFKALQVALKQQPGGDPYVRASAVLARPMMQAMQAAPVPDAVWRTAVRDHTLGTQNPVAVKQGDKIYVSIVGATQEDLGAGVADVMAVFGGDRKTMPHPTHACPGYEAAIGIMLGFLNGLLEPT